MQSTVHIIDSDPAYSRLLIGRLHAHLPGFSIQSIDKNDISCKTFGENDVILYDSKTCKSESISREIPAQHVPTISLRDQNSFRKSARLLSKTVRNELHISEAKVDFSCNADFTHRGRLVFFISLSDFSKRETYISANTTMIRNNMNFVYRLNLMPGIRMPHSKFERSTSRGIERSASGISELLLKLSGKANSNILLSSYVNLDDMGFHNFGRPVRSDDIIDSDVSVLTTLINLLRKEVDMPENKVSAVVVLEGLSFKKLELLCPLAHEIHMILPNESENEDSLFNNEIESLFRSLPPQQLKFVNASERVFA